MSGIKKIVIFGAILILLIISALVLLVTPSLVIKLSGEKYQTISVGDKYIEKGATAYIVSLFKKTEVDYKILGNVDTSKVGKYIITYTTKTTSEKKEIIRVITVIDDENPVISLNNEVKGCKKNNLIEIDATATDNYDGDLTQSLKYKVDNNKIQLYVQDSSDNKTMIEEKITYIDEEKPVITLNGAKVVYLYQGEEYIEAGASAYDSCDGNITDKVEYIGTVNIEVPGEYKITYKVKDSSDNITELERNIIVLSPESSKNDVFKVINGATIYLTFDDGPGKYTEEILNVLKKYDVKATFFVTNQFPKYQNLIKKEYEEGHTIGIHTYSHKWSIYESVESYLEDFKQIDDIIYNEIGIHTNIFRFPGGSSNTVSRNYKEGIMTELAKVMSEKGYIYFDWTIDSGDTNKKKNSKQDIIKNIKSNLKGDGEYVILMHDIRKNTLAALPEIIEYAKAHGYEFAALQETSVTPHFKIRN